MGTECESSTRAASDLNWRIIFINRPSQQKGSIRRMVQKDKIQLGEKWTWQQRLKAWQHQKSGWSHLVTFSSIHMWEEGGRNKKKRAGGGERTECSILPPPTLHPKSSPIVPVTGNQVFNRWTHMGHFSFKLHYALKKKKDGKFSC